MSARAQHSNATEQALAGSLRETLWIVGCYATAAVCVSLILVFATSNEKRVTVHIDRPADLGALPVVGETISGITIAAHDIPPGQQLWLFNFKQSDHPDKPAQRLWYPAGDMCTRMTTTDQYECPDVHVGDQPILIGRAEADRLFTIAVRLVPQSRIGEVRGKAPNRQTYTGAEVEAFGACDAMRVLRRREAKPPTIWN